MTPERARKIFAHVAEQRLRWGKHYHGDDEGIHNILDAMVVIAHEGNKVDADTQAEITKLRRQLAAANARDAKRGKAAANLLGGEQHASRMEDADGAGARGAGRPADNGPGTDDLDTYGPSA